ncbi:BrnT family toxin [Candidatus Thiosymbion oneisti]|uniref:BrnT family toxin n=1 Tax=Candidatus Thiosymbion oneisti TaxID=589554 RepID=UPI00105CA1DC|nr:BrnT family toxin [Candidatus Thiosymbion oneisti]
MEFEWDEQKAIANRKKHGVTFEEASTVFRDPLATTGADPDHSLGEQRWVTFGISDRGRLLVVAHAERLDCIRIISARPATKTEQKIYERA